MRCGNREPPFGARRTPGRHHLIPERPTEPGIPDRKDGSPAVIMGFPFAAGPMGDERARKAPTKGGTAEAAAAFVL